MFSKSKFIFDAFLSFCHYGLFPLHLLNPPIHQAFRLISSKTIEKIYCDQIVTDVKHTSFTNHPPNHLKQILLNLCQMPNTFRQRACMIACKHCALRVLFICCPKIDEKQQQQHKYLTQIIIDNLVITFLSFAMRNLAFDVYKNTNIKTLALTSMLRSMKQAWLHAATHIQNANEIKTKPKIKVCLSRSFFFSKIKYFQFGN